MAKTTEELMKPRYKVIADYPYTPFMIGAILHPQEPVTNPLTKSLHLYPHLFRKLQWWEERRPEDMPEYLESLEISPDHHFVIVENNYPSFFDGWKNDKYWEAPYHEYKPATESDYSTYLQSQQKKIKYEKRIKDWRQS